jgi:hypothetical protein
MSNNPENRVRRGSKINAPCEGQRSGWATAADQEALYRETIFFTQHISQQKCIKNHFITPTTLKPTKTQ